MTALLIRGRDASVHCHRRAGAHLTMLIHMQPLSRRSHHDHGDPHVGNQQHERAMKERDCERLSTTKSTMAASDEEERDHQHQQATMKNLYISKCTLKSQLKKPASARNQLRGGAMERDPESEKKWSKKLPRQILGPLWGPKANNRNCPRPPGGPRGQQNGLKT